jgi:acetyl esterase/lipase
MLSVRAKITRWSIRTLLRPLIIRGTVHEWRKRTNGRKARRSALIQPVSAGGVPAEWVTPPGASERVIYYLHGGGWVMCSPSSHRSLVIQLARSAGARALVLDYRLAPEHRFPAALDDCVAGYRWLLAQGVRPSDIVMAGDSAGGTLTLSTLIRLRDAGDPLPAGGICLSPATDLSFDGESHTSRISDEVFLTPAFCRAVTEMYLGDQDPRTPLASPLYAELRGLPPVLMHVGTHEVLLDDSRRFAMRAREAGVEVTLKVWDGMWHVFHIWGFVPEARAAVDELGQFARERFAAGR